MSIPLAAQEQPIDHEVVATNVFVDSSPDISSCAICAANELNLCPATYRNGEPDTNRRPSAPLAATFHAIPARRTILHSTEWSEFVSIICHGWAMSSAALPDGRRQILSFLLPGDMLSAGSLFEPISGRPVEAVTDVTYRNYKRSDLKSILFEFPDAFDALTKPYLEEKKQADQLAVDLGSRTADERIARLILYLKDRLTKRGMAQDHTMEFPLRQHHIADATGLTPVHVSKVLSKFRRDGLIEISNRSLTVLDPAEFGRVANML